MSRRAFVSTNLSLQNAYIPSIFANVQRLLPLLQATAAPTPTAFNTGPSADTFTRSLSVAQDAPTTSQASAAAESEEDAAKREHADTVLQALIDQDAPQELIDAYKEQYDQLGIPYSPTR
jgi:hypothetical protein